jgi:hypothetical protein
VGAPEGELWPLIPPFSVVWIVDTVHDSTVTPPLCQNFNILQLSARFAGRGETNSLRVRHYAYTVLHGVTPEDRRYTNSVHLEDSASETLAKVPRCVETEPGS